MQERVAAYHNTLNKQIDATSEYANEESGDDFFKDDETVPIVYDDDEEYFGLPDAPDLGDMINSENERTQSDSYDKYIGAEIVLPNSADQSLMAKVKRKLKSNDQNGTDYHNPLREHSRYEVEFPDGTTDEVEANVVAESMVAECDPEKRQYRIFKEISDHRKDKNDLNVTDGSYVTRAGNPLIEENYEGLAYFDRMARWKYGLAQTIRY